MSERVSASPEEVRLSAIADMLDYANDLKRLPRTGWLLAGVNPVESIADHSFATTLLALQLAQAVNSEYAEQGLPATLNIERVLRIALLHDLGESILTDLPKRTSQMIGDDAKHTAEEKAWRILEESPQSTGSLRDTWMEYAEGKSNEARLVKDADKLEMLHQALRYASAGNRNLDDFWSQEAWAYPISSDLRHLLLRRYGVEA